MSPLVELVVPGPPLTSAEMVADKIAHAYQKAIDGNPRWMPPPDLRQIIVSHMVGEAMTPMLSALIAQEVAAVVDIMMDYRMRRLLWMKEHPEHIGNEDAVPEELTREAEAAAIISKLVN